MAWIKQSAEDPLSASNTLVAYAYRAMAKADPEGFANFILGGMTMTPEVFEQEATSIANDYQEGAKWVEGDPKFDELVQNFISSQKTNEAEWHKSL